MSLITQRHLDDHEAFGPMLASDLNHANAHLWILTETELGDCKADCRE